MIGNRFQKSNTKKKYNSVTTEVDGIKFDSKSEAECYSMLKILERSGHLKLLEVHPVLYLTKARIKYISDFKIEEAGKIVYLDVKGVRTTAFNIKLRLFKYYGEGTLRLVQKNGFGFDKIKEVAAITTGGTDE